MIKKFIFILMTLYMAAGCSVQAATLNYIPIADATYFKGSGYGANENKFYNSTFVYAIKDHTNNYSTPYLKFNLMNEKNNQTLDFSKERIISAQLKLFLYDAHNYMYNTQNQQKYYINNRVDAHFVSDDTWVEPTLNTYSSVVSAPIIDISKSLGSVDLPIGYQGTPNPSYTINFDIDFLNKKMNEIELNKLISLALVNTTPTNGDYWWSQIVLQDREYLSNTKTMLILETGPTPTPEPSSMLLGIMGLGAISLRKRATSKHIKRTQRNK